MLKADWLCKPFCFKVVKTCSMKSILADIHKPLHTLTFNTNTHTRPSTHVHSENVPCLDMRHFYFIGLLLLFLFPPASCTICRQNRWRKGRRKGGGGGRGWEEKERRGKEGKNGGEKEMPPYINLLMGGGSVVLQINTNKIFFEKQGIKNVSNYFLIQSNDGKQNFSYANMINIFIYWWFCWQNCTWVRFTAPFPSSISSINQFN